MRAATFVSPLLALALWQVLALTHAIDTRIVPAPTSIVLTMIAMFRDDALGRHALTTIARFAGGLAIGTIPGVFLGLTMGLYRYARLAFAPLVSLIYPLPHIAIFPIVLILLGQNERANLFMIAFGPLFITAITTMGAVLAIEPIYRDVARVFGTSPRDLYVRVVLPAVLPAVFSGLRVALGAALISTIAVEFLVGDSGLGHVIWNAWQTLALAQSMAALVLTGIIGVGAFAALGFVERRLVPWRRSEQPTA